MEQLKGISKYLKTISKGVFTDVDFFVSFLGVFPELVIMVEVDWDKLLSDESARKKAYNFELYLSQKYGDDVRLYLKLMSVNLSAKLSFQIMNWP